MTRLMLVQDLNKTVFKSRPDPRVCVKEALLQEFLDLRMILKLDVEIWLLLHCYLDNLERTFNNNLFLLTQYIGKSVFLSTLTLNCHRFKQLKCFIK